MERLRKSQRKVDIGSIAEPVASLGMALSTADDANC